MPVFKKRLAGEDDVKTIYPKKQLQRLNSLRARPHVRLFKLTGQHMDSEDLKAMAMARMRGLTDEDGHTNQIK
jgi:hypothetical protein